MQATELVLRGLIREAAANTIYADALARRLNYSLPDVTNIIQQTARWQAALPWWDWAGALVQTPWVARPYTARRWWHRVQRVLGEG
jgi:hypothetical protein